VLVILNGATAFVFGSFVLVILSGATGCVLGVFPVVILSGAKNLWFTKPNATILSVSYPQDPSASPQDDMAGDT
jgi:hypothetical protein